MREVQQQQQWVIVIENFLLVDIYVEVKKDRREERKSMSEAS